ncbi:efflux RND transporter periplasmic adaptor subunit [Anatilimnocola floriformis]|uniref:efflux RND transporter periplasmic adaptor subunit n=1 Tax=Anatilimnocola floriformis TaxID=2948575 RepID=UPI0020C2C530|nr:efflux RND transporter periplasmic adaptor subunit [Anatilimnocola floriformis]
MPDTLITPAITSPHSRTRSQVIRVISDEPSTGWSWRSFAWPAVVLGVAVPALAAFKPWEGLSHEAPTHQTEFALARFVTLAQPQAMTAGSVVLPATIRPWQSTDLNARVSGYLKAWHADLGDNVKAGQLLAEIETPELDQEVAEGEAQAAEALAAAVQARAERAEAQAELNVAIAQLARVDAETELVRTQYVRRESLLAKHAVSQEEFDSFQKQYEARIADVKAAQADVARRRTSLETKAAIITAREATANSRQANVERLKELQGFQKITAPFAGRVTRRDAEVGMLVSSSSKPLFTIEDVSRVRVQISVPQSHAAQLDVGATATITVPESRQPAISAQITRISGAIEVANRSMLAEVELDNAATRLQPGSYAQVLLATSASSANWTIPASTLQMRVEGPRVAVIDEQNRVEIRTVTLGRDLGDRVQVNSGIHGGERLVVNPTDDLANGHTVTTDKLTQADQR